MADDKFDPTTAKPVDATQDGFDPSSAYVPTIGGELKKGALRGIDTMQQGGYGLIAAAANAAGAKGVEDWAREGVARNAQEAQENPAAVGRIEDIGGVRDAALWASGGLGEQAAPMAISIAGAAVGAPGAGYAAKALGAAPGVIARAAEIGAIVGAGATSIGQETGSIAADQIQDGNLQPGKALAYGVPAGLLDVIPESRLIRRIAGHGKAIGVARDIATQAVLEGAPEAAQTALERKGNDKEVLSKEGISEMLNAAALGALGGGVVRAVSRPFDGAAAPAEPPPPEPVIAGLLPAPGQIPIQAGQGDFRTPEQIQAEIDAERNASEIYAARDAYEAARRPPPPPPNAGLLPAPGGTVIPVPPAGPPAPNLGAEAADINAGAIQEARDAYEARQAALRAGAQQPAPLALPAPGMPLGNTVLPNDAGPFSVTQTHIANDAQDHANAVEAAREAEIARLEASGPIGRAAAASMRTGAAQMAGAARAEEASGAAASPLALPEPLTEKDKRAQERVTKFAADLPAVTLAQAQAVAQRATERYGEPVVVVPHPSGRGFTAVPQKVVSDGIRQQFDGIQREGGLPSPKPPESQLAVSPSGEVAAQPVPEGMRSTMADWRRDMDTPTPKGAEPTGAAPPPIPPQLPIKKREAAVAKAEKLTAETGREHEVVPHPFMRNAFAVRPVERVQEPAPSTEGERAPEANKVPATDEPKVGTDVPKMGTDDARSELDTAAHEAATSLENELPQPTKAQAEAGNYRKGHIKLHGLDISIENPAGSVRVGESEDGNAWASSMPHHYGYIRRSEGADGDHVDTFIGPKPNAKTVFVVNQVDPKTGAFDEHKVMLGFDTQDQAEAAYRAAYPKDWSGMGSVVATDIDGLKAWMKDGDTTTPFGEAAAGKERGTKEANALTHRPSALVHVKANPLADGVPLPPSSVAKKVMSEPPLVVTDRFDGRKTPAHLVKTVLSILGDAMRLGLPPSAIDGINSFYIKRKDTGAEYAIEAQSIGFSLDTLEAQYRGSQAWASTNVGHAIHEVGHHVTGDETGTSYVAMSPAFEVSIRDGKRVAVGAVMREALDAYNAGGELGTFLRYPLVNWGVGALDGLSIQDVTIILQEEVFAQSWALYFTNPELLRSRMPQTFRLMEEVANAARSETSIAGARREVQRALRSWRPEMGVQVGRGARLAAEAGTREREADRGLGGGRGVLAQGAQARSGLGLAAPVPVDRLLNVDRDTQREVYGRFGELTDRNTADELKVYDLSKLVDDPSLTRDLLARTGFKVEYFSFEENQDKGVTFRIPQLKKNGYQQGTLWIYDPRNSHGAFNDIEYTRQWRIVHELGHGLSERFMQAKYGDSKRQGRLGMPSTFPVGKPPKQVMREQRPLTLREAQRAVEWEDVAFRTQRMLMEELGVKVAPKDFAREYNINISDAIYRVLTADFGDPGDFGLVPKTELPNLKSILELLANTERELAKKQGREPTDGVDLSTWRPVSDLELRGAIRGARRPGTLDAETPIKHAVRLETRTFKGRVGDRSHITRTDEGTIATSLIANLAGERGEKRGEHRNRIGEEWDQFKRDIAVNGINEPIFITVDPGVGARVSEGNHRLDAAIELGLSTVPVDIRYYGHAERDGLVHERAKRSGALDVKTPVVYRGEHGEDGRRPGRLEVRDEPTESGRKSSKVGAERGARVTGRRMLSGADALKIAGEGVKLGLTKKEIRALQDQARKDMSRFPPSDGWAKLEIVGVDRKPKTLSDGSVVYDAVVKYKAIPYKFNAPPGAERAPQNIDMAWAGRVAKVGVKEIVDLYERARAGDAVSLAIVSHASWYRAMTSRLREEFGAAGDFYADLLGATSPNTPVDINWRFAIDIIKRFSRGELKEEMVAFEKWISEGKDISKFPAEQKIRQISGKLYGMNSGNAMVAIANLWRNIQPGTAPKARNFALNLIGQSNMATIDVWAARFLRRLANSIRGASFPRIPTVAEKGVTGKWNANATAVTGEFGFGAEVMKQMSEELARRGINLAPPDLQAVAWFLEKSVWTRNGWTSEQGEGGSFEVEADKAGLERFLAGWSIQRGNDRPADHEVELEAGRLLATVRSDEDVVSARAAPTIGMYDAETGERSFDTELTVRPGWSPWAFVSELARISRDRLQDSFFFSRALKPNEEHENARPGVEIYFKTERDLGRTVPLIRKLVESGQQGFTLTVDPRSERAGGVEASKFNGIRIQYVPEFEIRFGGPNAAALSSGDKKAVSDIIAAKREELEQIVQRVMNDDVGVALAKLFNYDTLVVAKEEYDVYAEAVAGGRAEESREALRPGQPIHEILADAARRYREGGEVGGADVPFGEAARPEGVTVEDPFEDAPKRPGKLEAKSAVAEPLWYSRLAQALDKAPWSKAGDMPVGQLRMWVAARSKDGTLPAEEVKWSDLLDYLDMYAEPKLKLQRSDVTSYLAQNGVRVEEVELGLDDQARLIKAEDALIKYLVTTKEFTHIGAREYALDAARGDLSASQFEAIEDGEHVRLVQNLRSAYQDRNDRAGGGQTKYHQYQLPGGENYRELLLTLPTKPEDAGRFDLPAGHNVYRPDPGNFPYRWRHEDADGNPIGPDFGVLPSTVGVAVRFAADRMHGGGRPNQQGGAFRSSHFDQPNILAHVRFNERRAADGSRVLFIEEIQSDWAQKGRKSGFVGKESDARKERDALMDEANNINRAPPTAERMAEIQRRLRELNDTGASVPTAPFVGKTESWVALALKRMIRYAADNGFDAVAWTNGEQQADRYDLSQHVDNVRIAKYGGGEFDIQARKGGDVVLSETQATQGRIAELVGKDIADKAARQEDGTHKTYSGLDLKVGGEGMKAFYDQIVRNVANGLLKKIGGKVESIEMSMGRDADWFSGEKYMTWKGIPASQHVAHWKGMTPEERDAAEQEWRERMRAERSQPGFRLTDDLKPKARRPQALFAKTELGARDVTETPEFKRWFGDSKVVDADGKPKVVYHGTSKDVDFATFRIAGSGAWFTENPSTASEYAQSNDSQDVRYEGGRYVRVNTASRVVPAYLSIKNPFPYDRLPEDKRERLRTSPNYAKAQKEIFSELARQGYDGVDHGGGIWVAFKPEQIKSAIGNRGTFDAKRPSILESRGELAERAQNLVADTLTTQRSFNLWDRTVGTQFHKAWKDPDFRKVYQGVQNYLNDASRLMMEAADLAPNVLPKLEGVRGILGVTASKADLEAMSSAIFDGTLQDVVYTDAQLAARGMSPEAIELYRETRSAIDRSLTDVFVSEAIKEAKGLLPSSVLAQARERGDPWVVVDALSSIPIAQRSEVQQQVYDQLRERAARIEDLKQQGYAPLMRFGRYTVHMTDANGGSLSFTMHESEREANAVARALRSEYPQHRVTQGVLSEDAWQLFQGISPDTLEIFAESVGASEKELFQKYLKLATNNRSTLRRLIQRKKIPGFSPDAQRALAQFLTSNGRAASRNYHWGEVLKAANDVPKERGDVKDEAVRLAQYVQHPMEEAGALRGLLFVQFLGGSVASALTNATQPVLMSFPYLSRFGAGKAAAALLGASKIAVGGVAPEADLRSAMERATEEGIIAPHEVAGLYAESIRNLGSNLVIRRILRAWGSLFSLAEAFNRRITFAAAFRLARDAGEADPYGFAVNAIAETQGVYNRGNRPNWARGAVGATIFTFKQYSIAYVEFLRRLPAKERAIAVAVLVLAAGIQGLPGADDLEDVVDTIAESLGYSFNSKKAAREWAIRTLGDTAGGMLSEGFSGLPGVPIDVQARLGLGNLIPGTGLLKRSNPDRSREVLEVFGPAGSQAKAFADAFGAAQEGNLAQIARSGLPLALQNAMKAVDMVSTGYYNDSRGRRVIDVNAYEAAIKGIGVQPKRVAEVQRRRQDLQQDVALQKDVEAEISDLWARGIFERDQEKVKRARAKLLDWNLANPESRIVIAPQQIQKRVQQASMTADQRFIKTAPPELRSRVAEELLR